MSWVAIDNATGEVLRIRLWHQEAHGRPATLLGSGVGVGATREAVERGLKSMFGAYDDWWRKRYTIEERGFVPPPVVPFEDNLELGTPEMPVVATRVLR